MATTQNDDDLIIIEEDNDILNLQENDTLIELDTKESDDLISFDDEEKSESIDFTLDLEETKKEEILDDKLDILNFDEKVIDKKEGSNELDLGSDLLVENELDLENDSLEKNDDNLSFGELMDEKTEIQEKETNIDLLAEEKNNDDSWLFWSEIENETEEISKLGEDETMSSILGWTISKLQSRKEKSIKQIEDKNNNVSDIETEVAKLQKEKRVIQKEVKELEVENAKIDSNIDSLERMKSDQYWSAVKNHNAKRKVNKKTVS